MVSSRRTVGSRRIRGQRPTPTITQDELAKFRDDGRRIVERPGGIVLLDGFRKFQLVDEPKNVEEASQRPKGDSQEIEGLSGGNELTGFDLNKAQGVNELTDFDANPGAFGVKPGRNELIDFE